MGKAALPRPPETSKGFCLWLLQEALRTALAAAVRHLLMVAKV